MNHKRHIILALKFIICLGILTMVAYPASPVWGEENKSTTLFRRFNPYLRVKKGPPLTNIFNKTDEQWLFQWVKEPDRHDTTAKMPNLSLSDEEVLAVLSYLKSIVPEEFPSVKWPDYLFKLEDELTDDEYDVVFDLYSRGKAIYRQARCSICHMAGGRGGVVPLQVGINLKGIGDKVQRDWLYSWLENPSALFPETFMPRFRFSEEDIRALIEYLMRDTDFAAQQAPQKKFSLKEDSETVASGKRIIELSRCVLCHEIEGIEEMLPQPEREAPSQEEGFAKLLRETKCLSCHKIKGQGGDYAPDLTHAGSKFKIRWLADFLQETDLIRPLSQQMPKLFLSREEAETAAKYIKKELVFEKELQEQVPKALLQGNLADLRAGVEEGRKIFQEKGCYSCHTLGGKGGALGPDLSMAPERLEPAYIYLHLKDPGRFVPFTTEPDFALSDEEAISLTVFLMNPAIN